MEQQNAGSSNLFDISIDNTASIYLKEAAKWARFLAIVGFIVTGLVVLFSLFAGTQISAAFSALGYGAGMGVMMIVFCLAGSLLYFFPCLYLFNFASKAQVALRSNDQNLINESLRNLKRFFKFIGILMIILLSFYALIFLFALAFGSMFRPKI